MSFDRTVFFDAVRATLFGGKLIQQQVDGMNYILDAWETYCPHDDRRWLSYFMGTAKHETASAMWPVEEYGKGSGADYGKPDPTTGQAYYGRGFVQLTWADNYKRADTEFGWTKGAGNSCYWKADLQLKPDVSARTGYLGMVEGWFRSDSKGRQTFIRYFSASVDDAFNAREIINGDRYTVPSWSNGVNIGNLIKGYHEKFLDALNDSFREEPLPPPEPSQSVVTVTIEAPAEIEVNVVRISPDA